VDEVLDAGRTDIAHNGGNEGYQAEATEQLCPDREVINPTTHNTLQCIYVNTLSPDSD